MTPFCYALGGAALAAALLAPAAHEALATDAFAGIDSRKSARVFYYERNEDAFQPLGQFSIDFGSPKWKAEYEADGALAKYKGMRWRFGSGFWTTLDTNLPLRFGDTEVAPGQYYCALEYAESGDANLVLLDPEPIRARRLDAFQATDAEGGISIPLEWTRDQAKVEDFTIELKPDDDDKTKVSMYVTWGPHLLSTRLEAQLD